MQLGWTEGNQYSAKNFCSSSRKLSSSLNCIEMEYVKANFVDENAVYGNSREVSVIAAIAAIAVIVQVVLQRAVRKRLRNTKKIDPCLWKMSCESVE